MCMISENGDASEMRHCMGKLPKTHDTRQSEHGNDGDGGNDGVYVLEFALSTCM